MNLRLCFCGHLVLILLCNHAVVRIARADGPPTSNSRKSLHTTHAKAKPRAKNRDDADRDDGDGDDVAVDAPENEAKFNREIWESIRKTPYKDALAYAARAQRSERARQDARSDSNTVSLPTGWKIAPAGRQTQVGRLPCEAVSFAGKIVVLNTGFYTGQDKPEVSVVDPQTGAVAATLNFGALFPSAVVGGDGSLYISGGFSKQIYQVDSKFAVTRTFTLGNGYTGAIAPLDATHIAVTYLVATDTREAYAKGLYQQGRLAILNTVTGAVEREVPTGYFPFSLKLAGGKLYAALLGEDKVDIFDTSLRHLKTIKVGASPQSISEDASNPGHLYVVNANSDSISVVDTSTDTITSTIDLNYSGTRFGGAPTSCAVGSDNLYVTLANVNALAVVDKVSQKLVGYVPTGWYPTKALLDDNRLYILNAKGIRARRPNPNGPRPAIDGGGGPDYVLTLLKGSLSSVPRDAILPHLQEWTQRVVDGSPLFSPATGLKIPIRHIFYIVRENRSYDQVMGDLPRGNNDPKLNLFGRRVTPNAHHLAEQFVTLDNYYTDAEISVLGHSFTTSGYASPFLEWLGNTSYSGRYKSYPYGSVPAVTSPAYLWDALDAKHIDYRIYGENYYLYTRGYALIKAEFGPDSAIGRKFYAQMMALATDTDRGRAFFKFANSYYGQSNTIEAAFALLNKPEYEHELSTFLCGDDSLAKALASHADLRHKFADYIYHYPSNYRSWDLRTSDMNRFAAWKTDFDDQVKRGKVAQLQYLWLPNDHTGGAKANPLTAMQFVAQNDAALAAIIRTISTSPVWKDSLILVTEDDAQDGSDHVDATRTVGLAVGPYVKRGAIVSDRYDQISLLRTVEMLLGLDPLNRGDALAAPMFGIFTPTPDFRPTDVPMLSPELADDDAEKLKAYQKAQTTK